MKKISEFKIKEEITATLLIKNLSKKTAKNNKDYYQIIFQDSTGEIKSFIWDTSIVKQEVKTGDLVIIKALVEEFNDLVQLRISEIKLNDQKVDLADFYKTAPVKTIESKQIIEEYISVMKNKDIKKLTKNVYDFYKEKFYTWPAAKSNHHEVINGLSFHTRTMLELAENIINLYNDNDYLEVKINKDYVYAGIILHDMAKTVELDCFPTTEYTTKGKLIGHISIMSAKIFELGEKLKIDDQVTMILAHLVLSHHGKLEYGSPIVPQTIEAELINIVDNIDSRMNMISKALMASDNEWSQRVFGLENRAMYNWQKKR